MYFTKWLPVEGEVKIGDRFWYEKFISSPLIKGSGCQRPAGIGNAKLEKVKLFLCSRDIQVNDRVYHEGNLEAFLCRDAPLYAGGYLKEKEKYFKVIGEISPAAIWVKEGDEFEEDRILRDILVKEYDSESDENEYTHYHPKGNELFKLGAYEKFIRESPIKIKCPTCGTFH